MDKHFFVEDDIIARNDVEDNQTKSQEDKNGKEI